MQSWWTASDPGDALGLHKAAWTSVNVPKTGTKVQVKGDTKKDWSVDVEITPAPASKRAQARSRPEGPRKRPPRSTVGQRRSVSRRSRARGRAPTRVQPRTSTRPLARSGSRRATACPPRRTPAAHPRPPRPRERPCGAVPATWSHGDTKIANTAPTATRTIEPIEASRRNSPIDAEARASVSPWRGEARTSSQRTAA